MSDILKFLHRLSGYPQCKEQQVCSWTSWSFVLQIVAQSIIEPSTMRWQRSFCGKGSRLWDIECWMSSHSTVKILCHFHAAIYNVLSKGKQGMRRVHFWTGSGHLRQKCKEQQSLIADHLYTAHYKCECDCSCTNVPQFSTKSILVDVHQFK